MKKVSIILPCHNEEVDIKNTLLTLKEELSKIKDYSFEIVTVDDGSKDETALVAKSVEGIHVVSYQPNGGKGHAVREGLKYSLETLNSDFMLFMDADLSTDLEVMTRFLQEMEKTPFVVASRYDKESLMPVKQPFKRRFISVCSRIIIRSMFRFGLKDTQCGFKGMNKETAKLLVEKSLIEAFAFDVEYLYILKLNKIAYKSVPVIWRDDRGSTVTIFGSSTKFFKDLFVIKKHKKDYLVKVEN